MLPKILFKGCDVGKVVYHRREFGAKPPSAGQSLAFLAKIMPFGVDFD